MALPRTLLGLTAAAFCLLGVIPALAACLPMVERSNPWLQHASYGAPLKANTVRLSFLGHSSFLIEGPEGSSAITDYNGYYKPGGDFVPDIVTMNNAHSTHYTTNPDPRIAHVLKGWGEGDAGFARHNVEVKGLRVRNVPTNARGFGGVRYNGNSIFVFEVANLCIAHLGHLHHTLTDQHLGELGVIDVLLVPADGQWTMAQPQMVQVIQQIGPSVVVPMHYFGSSTLGRFLALMENAGWTVEDLPEPSIAFNRLDLPYRSVLVMAGR